MTPLTALATALTYVIVADREVTGPDRALLLTVLGKHVYLNKMSQQHFQKLTADAFEYAREKPIAEFLLDIEGVFSPGQAISVYLNLFDAMLVDGTVSEGERQVLKQFRDFFGIEAGVDRAFRQIMMLKNDTSMFLQSDHPCNDPGYNLRVAIVTN